MAEKSNIGWTDATVNFFWGCSSVGPGCLNCYAETLNNNPRFGGTQQWGPGAPRRKIKGAASLIRRLNAKGQRFLDENGRRMNVFMQSMSDTFDNEVDESWRTEALEEAEAAEHLNIQMLTKRGPNVPKMVPKAWMSGSWPKHIGLMFTVVTQPEFDRDVPRLHRFKNDFKIPWVGLSVEPQIELIEGGYPKSIYPDGPPMCCSGHDCGCRGLPTDPPALWGIDWLVQGCESGSRRRPFEIEWARQLRSDCEFAGTAYFLKQIPSGKPKPLTDIAEFPEDLRVQTFPKWDRLAA
jgi:protein gp37